VAVVPCPVSVDEMTPVVFVWVPGDMAVTFTENVHWPLAASVPPVRLTVDAAPGGLFGVAVIVPEPHDPVTTLFVSLTFVGSVSANDTPVSAKALGFVTVKLSVDGCPMTMVDGVNDFTSVGGEPTTVSVAAPEVLFVPPLVDETVTVLFFCPEVVLVTLTVTVHGEPVATVPPVNVTLVLPGPGAKVAPPQLVSVAPVGFATAMPDGNVSVNVTPV